MMVHPEKIEHLSDSVVDEVVNRFRMKVEGRGRGEQNSTHSACLEHQFDMAKMEWGFPDDQNEFSPFLERHICSPNQKIFIKGVGNSRKAFNGTGDDHHSFREKRAAGDIAS